VNAQLVSFGSKKKILACRAIVFLIRFCLTHHLLNRTKNKEVTAPKVFHNTPGIYRCPKNGVLTVHYGVEEIAVNVRKMLKKFYSTYFLIWPSLKVALNTSIILKYMYEIVMTATSSRTYYHKVQDQSLPIYNPA
jgi:hypothetical protein